MAKKKKRVVKNAPINRDSNNSSKLGDDSKLFAFLATFLSILGFIIALALKKDDKYVMHYAKQSLIVFIVYIIAMASALVPFVGWFIFPVLYIITLVLWIISWVYALSGELKIVPVVGSYAKKLNF